MALFIQVWSFGALFLSQYQYLDFPVLKCTILLHKEYMNNIIIMEIQALP